MENFIFCAVPVVPLLKKILLYDKSSFCTSGMDNFGPLYVKNIFQLKQDDNATLCKVWVTLYTCAASRAVILNLTRHIDSHSFVRSFRLFIARCGCPSNVISDSGRNFILDETFIHSLGVDWKVNLPLASCYGEFFESLVRSTKVLIKKVFATVAGLLFGRQLELFHWDPFYISYTPADLFTCSGKTINTLNHFWDRWKKEYLINLRENRKVKLQKFNRPQLQLKHVVIAEEERQSRSGNPGKGELESLKNFSKERKIEFEVLKSESLKL